MKEEVRKLIENYNSIVREGKKSLYSEADVGSKFILPLLKALGWDITKIEDVKEQRRTLTGVADYTLLNRSGTSKIFLELKKFEENLDGWRRVGGKVKSFPQIAIDYAWQSRSDWAVLTNFEETRLYYSRVKKPEEGLVFKLKYHEYLTNFAKLWLISKESVVSGLLDTYEKRRLRKDIDEELLKDLVYCRKLLISNIRKKNSQLSKDEINESTQKILDRLMFIRSCEDRRIIPSESLWTQFETWQKTAIDKSVRTFMMDLRNIFRDFDAVYNGQLFASHFCEDLRIENETLQAVLILLYNYNFDLIPVNVLGNAYELYIGTIIKKKAGALKEEELTLVEEPSVRKKHGIYYTPEYIVDYIVRNTLGEKLRKCKTVEDVSKIKVLDPACGSGSFLIKAFDVIKEWYERYNKQNQFTATRNTLDAHLPSVSNIEEKILTENLHGIDLDPQAVEITILNLSLKAVKTKEKLPYMGDHIVCGNSLISGTERELKDYFADPQNKKPLDWQATFPEVFKQGGFDIIIGNPPYVFTRGRHFTEREKMYYLDNYKSTKATGAGKWNRKKQTGKLNTFSLFLERGTALLKPGGLLGYIVPNNVLRVTTYDAIRKFMLDTCKIRNIMDLSGGVFKGVTAATIIILLQREINDVKRDLNEVNITFDIQDLADGKYKTHSITQESFLGNVSFAFNIYTDKTLFRIFKKIEKNAEPLDRLTKHIIEGIVTPKGKKRFLSDKKETEKHKKFLEGKDIGKYSISYKGKYILYDRNKLHRPRQEEIFNCKEKILVRRISGGSRVIKATYDNEQYYTFASINNILLKDDCSHNLKYVLALLNSKLLNAYYRLNFTNKSDLTVNISKTYLEQLPIHKINFLNPESKSKHEKLVELVEKILKLNKELNKLDTNFDRYVVEPIIYYTPFRFYYDKLSVDQKKVLDKTSKGRIKKFNVLEWDDWLIFKVDYVVGNREHKDFEVLKCEFKDELLRKFLFFVMKNHEKLLGTGHLLYKILEIPIPCFNRDRDQNKLVVYKIMEEYLRALRDKKYLEEEIQEVDNRIDREIYQLYVLTPDEVSTIENALR